MACDGCNTTSKILTGVGFLVGLIGICVAVAGVVTGSSALTVEWAAEDKTTLNLEVSDEHGVLGYTIYMEDDGPSACDTAFVTFSVTAPEGAGERSDVTKMCHERPNEETQSYMTSHEPPLRKLARFSPVHGVHGEYVVNSQVRMWATDDLKEIGEAVGGIFAAMGMMIIAIAVVIVGFIFCCVACCCMGKTVVVVQQQQPGMVVGAPAANS